jgi:rhodanese-related sulfurtransferase
VNVAREGWDDDIGASFVDPEIAGRRPNETESETMKKSVKQLLTEANTAIETCQASDAIELVGHDGVVFVDIRDLPELLRDGQIPGAIHASRGMLEFHADPGTPYHKDVFSSGKKLVLYCASGGRSALAAQRLQEMGLDLVAHLGGGFKAWKEAGGPVEEAHGTSP